MPTREVTRGHVRFFAGDCPQLPEFWKMYAGGWERSMTRLIASCVRPGDIFLDIGAWIGPHALYAAALGARVIAVEPDPVAVEQLTANVALNSDMLGSVSIWPGAVVAGEGEEARIASKGSYGDSLSHLSASGMLVLGWTLPGILTSEAISPAEIALAKIDVEGYEKKLMATLGPWLGQHDVPLCVSFHEGRLSRGWFGAYDSIVENVEYVSPRTSLPWGELIALPKSEGSRRGDGQAR